MKMPVIHPDGTMDFTAQDARERDDDSRACRRTRRSRRRMPRRKKGLAGRVRDHLDLEPLPSDRECE